MQFHLNGFQPGDPDIRTSALPSPDLMPQHDETTCSHLPEDVDVLVVGTGPAGTVLAAQLAEFPEITTLTVERQAEPLKLGRADGVACRTVEMFQAFGLAERLMREAYWVNETVFWRPDETDPGSIMRSGRVQDVAEGLSEFPHVIVNQARMQELLLERMRCSPSRARPVYGVELVDLHVDESGELPVVATVRTPEGTRTVRARYAVGCDGARSTVRDAIGVRLQGDAKNHAWGVMDVLADTDFPDVRFKAAVQSSSGGLLIIPREGGYLVRFYVDLGELDPSARGARARFTLDNIIDRARTILHPHTLEVRDVAWWSVYEVGQRIADRFDDVPIGAEPRAPRVFIAGDACHTHSAKAGQGMNVSMQDGFNLGWKLAHVLLQRAPQELLTTYSQERRAVAQELIDFDTVWSSAMAAGPRSAENPNGLEASEIERIFTEGGRFTAGFGTRYEASMLTDQADHQPRASGFPIGERFHSAPVVRLADARPLELGHQAEADGRWRVYIFADERHPRDSRSRFGRLCRFLDDSPDSPVNRHTPDGADPDSVIDVRAVVQQSHRDVTPDEIPSFLRPRKGKFRLVDHEKVFSAARNEAPSIFDARGIHRSGCMVIVRPDQYISTILPLDAHQELVQFFNRVLLPASDRTSHLESAPQ